MDDEVVTAAKRGDEAAWRELFGAHGGRLVLWLAARRSGDGAVSAEDLAAEAWLVAARRLPDFSGTSEQFAGWLFGIARKVAANHARRAAAVTGLDDETVHRVCPPVEGPESDVAGLAWVRGMLAPLSPRERDVLACMEVVGLDVAATASALGLSGVAVRVARHRGLRRLRTLVDVDTAEPLVPASRGALRAV